MKLTRILLISLLAVFTLTGLVGCSAEAKRDRALKRAAEAMTAGKREEAKIECLNVLKLEPTNLSAHEMLGRMWLDQGSFIRAATHLQKQIELAPNAREARLRMAEINLWLGKAAAANREAQAVLERRPEDGEAVLMLLDSVRTSDDLRKARELTPKSALGDVHLQVAAAVSDLLSGDVPTAKRKLERIVSSNPKSAAAHLALAKLLLGQGDRAGADREHKLAAELAPKRTIARLGYAQFKARTGAIEEAAAAFREIARETPDYLPAITGEAEASLALQKLDRAHELTQQVLKQDGANYDALLLDARILLNKGDLEGGIARLEKLGSALPNISADKFYLGRAYIRKKEPEKAIAALQQAVRMNPDNELAMVDWIQLKILNGQAEAAARDVGEYLMSRPQSQRAQALLGEALRASGRRDDAIKVAQERARINPQNPQPHVTMGFLLREQNKPEEARASFEKALSIEPLILPAIAQLVELDLREKKIDAALARVKNLHSRAPNAPEAHFLEAGVYVAEQKWELVEAPLLKAIEINEDFGPAYDLLLATYTRGNRLQDGVKKVEGILAKRAGSMPALMLGAMMYLKLKDYEKSGGLYERALKLRPNATLALNNLAYIYCEKLNQLDRAYELATKLHELEPTNAAAADTLGWILYKRKEYPRAFELIESSANRLPNVGEIQFHLGKAGEAVGKRAEAKAAYERAAKSKDDFPGKSEITERLASLADVTAAQPKQ